MTDHKQDDPHNLAIVVCHSSPQYIVVEKSLPKLKDHKNGKVLIINRKTSEIREENSFSIANFVKRTFSAFLGIVNLEGYKFAVFCDEAKIACSVPNFPIFEISTLFFLSFQDEKIIKRLSCRRDIYCKIRDLNVILQRGFYFSHQYNLTRTFEYQKLQYVKYFTWNKLFLKHLEEFPFWVCPITQGFVSFFEIFMQGTKIYYILISRRSNQKGGTRYFDRGVNEEGFVANYVQTEQIVQINDYVVSDVQIRGSVPLFFEQKGLTTKIKLTRGYELTHQTFCKHITMMLNEYQRVFWVNLLSLGRSGETILIKQLQKHLQQLLQQEKEIKYMYFDFHKHAEGGYFEKVDLGVDKVAEMKRNLKYYIYDCKKDEVLMRQHGIFRTNCLDSLDRTNFFQAKLAMITLEDILSSFEIYFKRSLSEMMGDSNQVSYEIVNFRNIWADNGDAISYHYTGTGSTHTDIIRNGKRGFLGNFKHKYKSVTRFYNQNFWDFYKMKLVDLLLEEKVGEVEIMTIPDMINERVAEFCDKKILDIYLLTWKPPKKTPTSLPLFPNTSDLIVVNLQQISEEENWKKIVNQAIDLNQFILVSQKCSSKNLLMIYGRQNLTESITQVQLTKVKFKSMYNTYLSTKCAVLIRFFVYSTKITFIGVQLEYGRQYSSNRIQNLKDIHKYAFQESVVGQKTSENIKDDDIIFLLGNINTNIHSRYKNQVQKFDGEGGTSLNLQGRRLVNEMVESDQFQQIQQRLLNYRYYEEQNIKFAPSYKYNKGKKCFDSEVSGWPDRIWYSTEKKIICSKYDVIEELREEHVPVFASYQVEVDCIDEEKQLHVSEQVFSQIPEAEQYLEDEGNQ